MILLPWYSVSSSSPDGTLSSPATTRTAKAASRSPMHALSSVQASFFDSRLFFASKTTVASGLPS